MTARFDPSSDFSPLFSFFSANLLLMYLRDVFSPDSCFTVLKHSVFRLYGFVVTSVCNTR